MDNHTMSQRNPEDVALSFYNNTYEASHKQYLSILASPELQDVRTQYFQLFDWNSSVLVSLRLLTDKLFFRGESQHIDTILQSFAESWYEKFKQQLNVQNSNGIYLISYSLILLNTDLHTSNGSRKHISKQDYVKNTLNALKANEVACRDESKVELELNKYYDQLLNNDLKLFNTGIGRKSGENDTLSVYSSSSSSLTSSINPTMARSFGFAALLLNERSLKKQPSKESINSSTTSMQSVPYTMKSSFSISSNLSNLNEIDDDFDEESLQNIVLEEDGDLELELDGPPWIKEGLLNVIMVDNEPEVQIKQSRFGFKKSKPMGLLSKWKNGFVVVAKGELRIFSFESTQQRLITNNEPIGAGNWYDNATCLGEFQLCQSYASKPTSQTQNSLTNLKSEPTKPLGHSYWSLTLPLSHVKCKKHPKLVFQCGSDEIAREFIDSCNFWAARSSNVPNENTTVSSFEYGWSKNIIRLIDTVAEKKDSESVKELLSTKITEWTPLLSNGIPSHLTMIQQLQQVQNYYKSLERQTKQLEQLKPKLDLLVKLVRNNKLLQPQTSSSFSFRKRQEPTTNNTINVRLIMNNYNKKLNYLQRECLKYKKYSNSLKHAINLKNTKFHKEEEVNEIYNDDEFGAQEKVIMVGD